METAPLRSYFFDSLTERLMFSASPVSGVVKSTQLMAKDEPIPQNSETRTGSFDNQGSPRVWTWAWTTDSGAFEIWRPSGMALQVSGERIILSEPRFAFLPRKITKIPKSEIRSLSIGKTGAMSIGILGKNRGGVDSPLIKDIYPVLDAGLNVTYDGISEDEDLFPLIMMARELARRLTIPFHERAL